MARHAARSPHRFDPVLSAVAVLVESGAAVVAGLGVLVVTLIATFYVGFTGTVSLVGILATVAILATITPLVVLAVNRWVKP